MVANSTAIVVLDTAYQVIWFRALRLGLMLLCASCPAIWAQAQVSAQSRPVRADTLPWARYFCRLELPASGPDSLPRDDLERQCRTLAERRRERACTLVSAETERICSKVEGGALPRQPLLFRATLLAKPGGDGLVRLRTPSLIAEAPGHSREVFVIRPNACADGSPDLLKQMPALWLLTVPVPNSPELIPLCTATAVAPGVLLTAAHCAARLEESQQVEEQQPGNIRFACTPHPQYTGGNGCAPSELGCAPDIALCRSADPSRPLDTSSGIESLNIVRSDVVSPVQLVGFGLRDDGEPTGVLCRGTARLGALSAPEKCPDPASGARHIDPNYSRCFARTAEGDRSASEVGDGDSGGPVFDNLVSGRRKVVGVLAHSPEFGSTASRFVQLSDLQICNFLVDQGLVADRGQCKAP